MNRDDYHELDSRIIAVESITSQDTESLRMRCAELEASLERSNEYIATLEVKLDATLEAVHALARVFEVAVSGFTEDIKPLMQQQDRLKSLTWRLQGKTEEEIRAARAFGELAAFIKVKRDIREVMGNEG